MGLSNFTSPNSQGDDQNPSGNGGMNGIGFSIPHGAGMPGAPAHPSNGNDDDAALELLVNYNEKFKNADPTRYRDLLIEQTLAVLIGKNKPNVLLVGSAGVGKTKIVEDIARRIAVGDTLIPDQLKDHTVYELPLVNLVSGSSYVGMLEAKVQAVVDFATNPANKVILFMDEIHVIADSSNPTYAKIAQILKPALARGEMRTIGATTSQESRDLDNDPAFSRRFSRLVVDELTPAQTFEVLQGIRAGLMMHYKNQITVSDDVLNAVVKIADQHSRAGSHRPDSAITLLDRAMADRVLEQKRIIRQAEEAGDTSLAQILSSQPHVPLTEPRVLSVAMRLLTGNATKHNFDVQVLDHALKTFIKGQDSILETLVDRLTREELGLFPRSTPIAWMFAGASGVGKTETAKIIARHVTDQDPIILNMTEYNSPASIARIIGSPAGYVGYDSNAEGPFDVLESNPHRVILLDEFEKADKAVQRLFLSALDEGSIKTSRGKLIDFSKAIVIATTNAAREAMTKNRAGFASANSTTTLSDSELSKALSEHFDAELLGRFSLRVAFNQITQDLYGEVVAAAYQIQRHQILTVTARYAQLLPAQLDPDVITSLTESSFITEHGARPARQAVRTWIEDQLIAAQRATTSAFSHSGASAGAVPEPTEPVHQVPGGSTEADAS